MRRSSVFNFLNSGQQEAQETATDKAAAAVEGFRLDRDAMDKECSSGDYLRSSSFRKIGASYNHTEYVEAHKRGHNEWVVQKVIQLQGINLSDLPGNLMGKRDAETDTRSIVPLKPRACYVEALYAISIYELTQAAQSLFEVCKQDAKDSFYLDRAHKDRIIFDSAGVPHIVKNYAIIASTDFPESEARLPALWKEQDEQIKAANEAERKRVEEEKRAAEEKAQRMPVVIDWSQKMVGGYFNGQASGATVDFQQYRAAVDLQGRISTVCNHLSLINESWFSVTDISESSLREQKRDFFQRGSSGWYYVCKHQWSMRDGNYNFVKFNFEKARAILDEYVKKSGNQAELVSLMNEIRLCVQVLYVMMLAQTVRAEWSGIYSSDLPTRTPEKKNYKSEYEIEDCQDWFNAEFEKLQEILNELYPKDPERYAKVLMPVMQKRSMENAKKVLVKTMADLKSTLESLETYVENGVRNFSAGETPAPLSVIKAGEEPPQPVVGG